MNMKSYQTTDADNNIRKHEADWHKKITLSISCLIFFFIGAPLGAIIRKGGLGMPVVVSVLIFVIYTKNEIIVPEKEQFKSGESFYGTLFHEMTHSTGAEGCTPSGH